MTLEDILCGVKDLINGIWMLGIMINKDYVEAKFDETPKMRVNGLDEHPTLFEVRNDVTFEEGRRNEEKLPVVLCKL